MDVVTMDILLETERLILRRLTNEDATQVYAVKKQIAKPGSLPSLFDIYNRWLPNILAYYQEGYGFGYWAAIEKTTQEFMGWFYFRSAPNESNATALGYFLQPSVWNQGYATEGARSLIQKGFTELGVERVLSNASVDNKASIRVMEKVGLRFEKWIDDDSGHKFVQYHLLKDEFEASASALTDALKETLY